MIRLFASLMLGAGCADVGTTRVLPVTPDDTEPSPIGGADSDDTEVVGSDTDVGGPSCVPRELGWREGNAPEIAMFAGGGIAWHPSTGLRTWGGRELLGFGDVGLPGWLIGFATHPWDIPAERWRSLFHTDVAPCMVHRDGAVGCRVDDGSGLPASVSVLSDIGGSLCWLADGQEPECQTHDVQSRWPSSAALVGPQVTLATGARYSPYAPFVCSLDTRGRARCDGPSEVIDPFENPSRCWLELVSAPYALCGIDSDGAVTCRTASYLDDDFADDTPTRRDLSHLSVAVAGACALDPQGRIVCWGFTGNAPDSIQNTAPDGPGFVDVAVESGAACALSDAGRVTCWGFEREPVVFDQPDRGTR